MSFYPWQSATLPDYVLLDPTASKRLARWLQRQGGPRAYLFDAHDLPREASPVLLSLAQPSGPRQVDELLRLPDGTPSLVWLWSPLELDALAAHLSAPIKPASPLGRIVFRYYDPRLLSRLPTILQPPQWQQLMAPLNRCAGQDGEGKGFDWEGEAMADAMPVDWELDDEQLERCGDWGLAWQLRQTLPAAASAGVDTVFHAIGRAHALGLSTQVDLKCFAELACALHPRFDLDTEVAPWLAGIARGVTLQDCLAQVAPDTWERLDREGA